MVASPHRMRERFHIVVRRGERRECVVSGGEGLRGLLGPLSPSGLTHQPRTFEQDMKSM